MPFARCCGCEDKERRCRSRRLAAAAPFVALSLASPQRRREALLTQDCVVRWGAPFRAVGLRGGLAQQLPKRVKQM